MRTGVTADKICLSPHLPCKANVNEGRKMGKGLTRLNTREQHSRKHWVVFWFIYFFMGKTNNEKAQTHALEANTAEIQLFNEYIKFSSMTQKSVCVYLLRLTSALMIARLNGHLRSDFFRRHTVNQIKLRVVIYGRSGDEGSLRISWVRD